MIVVIPQKPLRGNDNAEGLLHFVALEGGIDMATERTNITTVMKLMVENGTTDAGAVKYAVRTLSSINPEITDEDLLAIGRELADMQTHDLGDVKRSDTATLITGA